MKSSSPIFQDVSIHGILEELRKSPPLSEEVRRIVDNRIPDPLDLLGSPKVASEDVRDLWHRVRDFASVTV